MKSTATESTTVYVDNIAPGTIVMWSGSLDNIPNGYALCDGHHKTPNLVDKFIYSSNEQSKIGQVGGNANNQVQLQSNNIPLLDGGSHNHSMEFDSGSHAHAYCVSTPTPPEDESAPTSYKISENLIRAGGNFAQWVDQKSSETHQVTYGSVVNVKGSTHDTTISIGQQNPTFVDITPQYVALAFIMKKYPTS